MLARVRSAYERLLEAIAMALMLALATIVPVGVIFRWAGNSLVWYDEIASILLAWITFYGAALAALRGAHIGVPSVVDALPLGLRVAAVLVAETCVIGFFGLMAWVGFSVLDVLATDYLVSIPEVSVKYTQSAIPIGATLFVIAELLRLPELLRAAAGGSAVRREEVNP